MSVRRQCELLGLNRSGLYYKPAPESKLNLKLMGMIDAEHLKHPFYGRRRMTRFLQRQGYDVNEKRVKRLMRKMRLETIYAKPNLSQGGKGHKVYPYLLRNLHICRVNQVWSTDITYVPLGDGYMYLTAVIDWFSRFVLSWRLSNTLDGEFCIDAMQQAFALGKPEIVNTDQGTQYTSDAFTSMLKDAPVRISMDGKGRALDNIFVERLWRSVKYEDIYIQDYCTVPMLYEGLERYFDFYNNERMHQSLDYQTPAQVHWS